MAPDIAEASFAVYGLHIRVAGDWPEVVEALGRDFAWFPAGEGRPDVELSVFRRRPDLTRFGPLLAKEVTWRAAEYRDGNRTIVDYVGRALAVDDGFGRFTIEGDHGWMVWRASHEYLLDCVGEHLNSIGLTCANGLGLAGRDGGALVILAAGGGKTTLTLRALSEGVGLVSEGSPLLDGGGRLHPFPLPLLVRTTSPEATTLPEEHVRRVEGIDDDPISLEVPAFAAAIPARPVPLRHVVLGVRSLGSEASLDRIPWRLAAPAVARATVGGFRVLHGGGVRDAPSRLWKARPRVAAFAAALRCAQPWRLTLGVDKDANWDALARVL